MLLTKRWLPLCAGQRSQPGAPASICDWFGNQNCTLSELYHQGLMEATSVKQTDVFEAAEYFARVEGILPAPESSHLPLMKH